MKRCAPFGVLACVAGLAVGLTGCAAVPQYPARVPADIACIAGDAPGYWSSASSGQATVEIHEIDGGPLSPRASQCVPAGIHRLGVSAVYNRQSVQDYVELGLDGGRQYRLRANLRGISFVFQLDDVTATPTIKVAQFSLKADYAPEAALDPVYVYYPAYPVYTVWGGYPGYGGYSWAGNRYGRYWNGRRSTDWNDGRDAGRIVRRSPIGPGSCAASAAFPPRAPAPGIGLEVPLVRRAAAVRPVGSHPRRRLASTPSLILDPVGAREHAGAAWRSLWCGAPPRYDQLAVTLGADDVHARLLDSVGTRERAGAGWRSLWCGAPPRYDQLAVTLDADGVRALVPVLAAGNLSRTQHQPRNPSRTRRHHRTPRRYRAPVVATDDRFRPARRTAVPTIQRCSAPRADRSGCGVPQRGGSAG